jgi:uridylate kinase
MIMVEEGRAVVFGGGKPGGSNDLNACLIANAIGTKKVFDLKNVSGVFTSDPKKDERAELIPDISWNDYLQVIGNPTEHAPGAHYPVDPLAARLAAKNGIDFCILHGDNITTY